MPKVSIREIDNTGGETLEYLDYTVLVPGPILTYRDTQTQLEGLYTKAEDFKKDLEKCLPESGDLGTTEAEIYDDKAVIMTYEYLKRGLSVWFKGLYQYVVDAPNGHRKRGTSDTFSHEDGKDYIQIDKDSGQALSATDISNFYKEFTDKGKYDLRFITTGGIADMYLEDAITEAIKCAGDRGDAVAILGVPRYAWIAPEPGEQKVETLLNTSELINKWVNDTFGALCREPIERTGTSWVDNTNETYGTYGAFFTPACDYKLIKPNRITETVRLPASFMYLTNFAKYVTNYADWYAMSGSVRGVSAYAPVLPTVKFGDKDVDIFQVRAGDKDSEVDGHIATNTVCEIRPYGNIIWGNRTKKKR